MNSNNEWTTVIRPKKGIFDLDLRELWRYRDLLLLFVRRDFVALYKQTILGPLWFFIQPLFTTVIFTVVFGSIAKIPTDGLPPVLFYMSGSVTWAYFQECLVKTSNTFIINAPIFGKVYFPRLVVPMATVLTNLIAFALQFLFFLGFLLYYWSTGASVHPNIWVLMMPVYLLMMAGMGLGLGIIVSSLTTKYRDLRFLITFGAQLLMYGTPVVYPLSHVPAKWLPFFLANPMTSIIESMRYAFLGTGAFRSDYLLTSAGIILVILIAGVLMFTKVERTFMDTV